ncbi:MAG: phosphate ABC transporter permease PstA [Capsulimonadaceae bacterium]|nr:phosphate ABC transporter permease PstA [Capsulimonadaceae bacterium]
MTTAALPARPNAHKIMRRATNISMKVLCGLSATIAVCALGLVLVYLVGNGLHSMSLAMLTNGPDATDSSKQGLRNAIVGTIVLISTASVLGLPIGILGGVYQIESQGRFASTIRFLTDVLNSIPSIVIGIFVYILVVLPVSAFAQSHHLNDVEGYSAFAGGVALAILMIPTVMRTTEEILRLVPMPLREGSLALGATRWRTMVSIVLPAARSGIITGIMLALARIAGETAPLIFTAFGNHSYSVSLFKPIDSLPWSIYISATQPSDPIVDAAKAHAGALILISLIFSMSIVTRIATRNSVLEEK